MEVEVREQVAEDLRVLADVGPRVGTAVGARVQPGAAQEVVLDELEIRVEAQRLVVDVAALRIRADHERRHAQPVALRVDGRRLHVVVEAAPVVPREEDRGRAPVLAPHDRVDQPGDVRLAVRDECRRVVADALRGRDPRDRRQRAGASRAVEGGERGDVLQLMVLPHGVEVGQRVPDARCLRVLRHRRAEHRVVGAVGLVALRDVVAPADVVAVEEIRQVGPRVVGRPARGVLRLPGRRARRLDGAAATLRVALRRAERRPAGDEVEVRRQAPRRVRLEHVILEDELARVVPVVRDLAPVVVAHDVGRPVRRERAAGRVDLCRAGEVPPLPRLLDEAVHRAAGDVLHRVDVVVRPAGVAVVRIVEGLHADSRPRVDAAHGRYAVPHRDPVRTGIRAEIGVERAVLLHDHDDVPDLVDAADGRRDGRGRGPRGAVAARQLRRGEEQPDEADPGQRHRRRAPSATVRRDCSAKEPLGCRMSRPHSGDVIAAAAPRPSARRRMRAPDSTGRKEDARVIRSFIRPAGPPGRTMQQGGPP